MAWLRLAAAALFTAASVHANAAAAPQRVLYLSTLSAAEDAANLASLRHELARAAARLGKVELQVRALGGNPADEQALAAAVQRELRAGPWGVVITATMLLAALVQRLDPLVPLVFEGASDPRRQCLVNDLLRPGRSATGYTSYLPSEAKMLEALLDAFPHTREVVVLLEGRHSDPPACDAGGGPPAPLPASAASECIAGELGQQMLPPQFDHASFAAMARQRGLSWRYVLLCNREDIDRLPQTLRAGKETSLMVPLRFLFYRESRRLVAAANRLGLPTLYSRHFFVAEGGLMSLAPTSQPPNEARAYELAVRILGGERAADLPVQTPEGFELRINLDTAAALGLRPSALALRRAQALLP
jgi:putative ABC transport system substrate-binding protein